jgi:hypothetical protein
MQFGQAGRSTFFEQYGPALLDADGRGRCVQISTSALAPHTSTKRRRMTVQFWMLAPQGSDPHTQNNENDDERRFKFGFLSFSPFFVDFLCNFEIDWNGCWKCRHVVLVAAASFLLCLLLVFRNCNNCSRNCLRVDLFLTRIIRDLHRRMWRILFCGA